MEPGGLEFGARGYSDVRHVRLMHAAVRWLIQNDPRVPLGIPALGHADQPGGPARDPADLHRDPVRGVRSDRDRLYGGRRGRLPAHVVADRSLPGHPPRPAAAHPVPDVRLDAHRPAATVRLERARPRSHGGALEAGRRALPTGSARPPASTVRYYVGDDTANLLNVPEVGLDGLFGPLADVSRRLSVEELHRRLLRGLSQRIGFGMLSVAVRRSATAAGPHSRCRRRSRAALETPPYSGPAGR